MAQNEIETPQSVIVKESDDTTDNNEDEEGDSIGAPLLLPRRKIDTISPVTPLTPLIDNDNDDDDEYESESKMEQLATSKKISKTPKNGIINKNHSQKLVSNVCTTPFN